MIKGFLQTIVGLTVSTLVVGQKEPLRIWYDKPAGQWEETLPLGNGRLGMMPDGGVQKEKIVLNDITLWSGSPQDANNYDAYKKLPEIRQLLLEGKNDKAQDIINQSFICTGQGSGGARWGCFQTLGSLHLQFTYSGTRDGDSVAYDHYQRELSLDNALAKCSYQVNGVTYKREYFTSFGDDIDMIRITADKPGMLSFTVSMDRPERFTTIVAGKELQMSGQLDNGTDGKGMQYQAALRATLKDGTLSAGQNTLVIKNATEVILYLAAATDFKLATPDLRASTDAALSLIPPRNTLYKQKIRQDLDAAMKRSYASELQLHIAHYRKLFSRMSIDLGTGTAASLPTLQRLIHFRKEPAADIGLPALFLQFGRYLTISSTRVGLLPPNLQGLWADQVHTPWNGDYHLDINVQMNHWPVEVTNLSELNLPLAELVRGMVPNGRRTAKAYYNAEGWVAHVITNVWGFTEPGESASWGVTKCGSGWLCDNLWQHYEFTGDTAYLRSIYPIIKGAAQFYNSMLIDDPKTGWLVTAPSSSPENSFFMPDGSGHHASICMGPTIDNQIIRELFGNVITAASILGKDEDLRRSLSERINKLPPQGVVAKDGRLMEWLEDYKEPEPQHRHASHLYGLYPASLITPGSTPALAEASRKTLEVRGDDGPSWSIAYKLLFWARLHDGNRAYKLFAELLKPTLKTNINYGAGGGVYPNLLSAGPPFQIDGNFGGTAGIAEMLIQSHAGFIELLPAIPDGWKAYGEVKGLKARGNFTVDLQWKNGNITNYRVASPTARKVKIKVNGQIKEILSSPIQEPKK